MSARSVGPMTVGIINGHHAVLLPDGRIAAYCGEVGAPDDAESRANAHLFSAGEEMLLALKLAIPALEVLRRQYPRHPADDSIDVLEFAREAMKKAEGGA